MRSMSRMASVPALAMALFVLAGGQPAAARTYGLDQSFQYGSAQLTGTIETDGRIGTISILSGGITDWDLTLYSSDYDYGLTLTPANSYLFGGGEIEATARELVFDFGASNYLVFNYTGTGKHRLCYQASVGQCSFGGGSGIGLTLTTGGDLLQYFETTTGPQVIAVASVPEPATLALWLAGMGVVGLTARRRIGA